MRTVLAQTVAARQVLPHGADRTDAWYAARRHTITASEIAAVLGLSPYTSPFDLWHLKASGIDSQPDNRNTRRGRRYEQLILEDFTEEHPEFTVTRGGLWVNRERSWQACTPDGLAHEATILEPYDDGTFGPPPDSEPVAVVEAKSAATRDEWGEPGTDDIPVHYRCQTLWQLDTLGLTTAYVPVLFGFDYREYVVTYDEADVALLRDAARAFLASLAADQPPPLDAHAATARRLKRLHPSLEDTQVIVPDDIAHDYAAACAAVKDAKHHKDEAENRLRDALGDGRWAIRGDGSKVATRSVYDVPERVQTVRAHTVSKLIPPRATKTPGTTVKEAVTP